ncbi:fluoride efflux transporter CrcB [Catalinimonas niigatensis]|uniref:fluoride efflux transporter CrcB n=1 Tax=Catalinimonas niigatensis TaxID=1397264 RepID=UPI002665A952|nr:fluoride efflux transporter CrcB [Catalinimonas niigatensis]WPP49514.1 fluoride efflux transporter CrcB [Catalinimonas niigatensis]
MLSNLLLVGIGGFLGSVLRFLISVMINRQVSTHFPFGTFTVNIIGSLLIGILYGLWAREFLDDHASRLWITGFCGGFTTFSTFSFDGLTLISHGQYLTFLIYATASVFVGLLAVYGGMTLVKV